MQVHALGGPVTHSPKAGVAGSNPAGGTHRFRRSARFPRLLSAAGMLRQHRAGPLEPLSRSRHVGHM